MKNYIEPIAKLVNKFCRLPSVGQKTAERYAYGVINMSDEEAEEFIAAIADVRAKVTYCERCGNFTDVQPCAICSARPDSIICVVKEPRDVLAVEKVRDFKGAYHVLHGVISPIDGVGPNDIRVKELLARIRRGGVEEVIMATPADVEGEATAMYLSRLLKPLGVKVTRIAHGIPIGGALEYADEVTLSRALEHRVEL